MGVVYRARDKDRGTVVALKTVRHESPGAILRLKQEFRSLMEVVHSNLVRLYELIFDGCGWYIVMELVDGGDFLSYVRGETAAMPDGYQRRGLTTTESHLSEASILSAPDCPGSAVPKHLSSSGRKRSVTRSSSLHGGSRRFTTRVSCTATSSRRMCW